MTCSECNVDQSEEFYATKYWKMCVSYDQTYLGTIVLFTKRHVETLSSLTSEEWSDLLQVIKLYEGACSQAFNPQLFNWTSLMNSAFQENGPKPHVHLKCKPRYDHDVEFAGVLFKDEEFGHHYARGEERRLQPEVMAAIRDELLKYIK